MDAFKAFATDIKKCCEESPAATPVSVVGAYNKFSQSGEISLQQV